MKYLFFIISFVSISSIAYSQFSDTAQLNAYIRDTIRDRRPEKVTALQLQKALTGLSALSSQYNAEIKQQFLSLLARDTAQIVNGKAIFDSLYIGAIATPNLLLYVDTLGQVLSSSLEQSNANSITLSGPSTLQQLRIRDSSTRLYLGDASLTQGPVIGLVGTSLVGSDAKGAIGMTFTTKNNTASGVRVTEYNSGVYTSVFEIQKNFTAVKNRLLINNGNSDDGIHALQVNGKMFINDSVKFGPTTLSSETNNITNINRTWFRTLDSTRDLIFYSRGGTLTLRGTHAQASERGGLEVAYRTINNANASFKVWGVNSGGTYTRKFEVQDNWTYLGNRLMIGSPTDDGVNNLQVTGPIKFSAGSNNFDIVNGSTHRFAGTSGNVLLGSTTDNLVDRLQVTGKSIFSDTVKASILGSQSNLDIISTDTRRIRFTAGTMANPGLINMIGARVDSVTRSPSNFFLLDRITVPNGTFNVGPGNSHTRGQNVFGGGFNAATGGAATYNLTSNFYDAFASNVFITYTDAGDTKTINGKWAGQRNVFQFFCNGTAETYADIVTGATSAGAGNLVIADRYGIYIDDMKARLPTRHTRAWGVYQVGADDKNYFQGQSIFANSLPLNLATNFTPTGSADSAGTTGDVSKDDDYIYIKTSTGWKRAALTTF